MGLVALEEQTIAVKLLQNTLENLEACMELLWHLLGELVYQPMADFEE